MAIFPSTAGTLPTAQNVTTLYVAPTGSNSNSGLSWFTPKETGAAAWLALLAAFNAGAITGGQIICSDLAKWSNGTEAAGLTDLQGPWIIDVPALPQYQPRGFVKYFPCSIKGDPAYSLGGFNTKGRVRLRCQSVVQDRFKSTGLWLIGACSDFNLENVQIGTGTLGSGVRKGWDFARNGADPDQGPLLKNVTAASRAAGVSTFTLQLPPAIQIRDAGRNNDITSIYIYYNPNNLICGLPWSQGGVPFTFTSTDSDFPSGTYTLLSLAGGTNVDGRFTQLNYSDGQTTHVDTKAVPGSTVQSHGLAFGETIDIVSTNPEWPSTMYGPILAATTTQITLPDPYGSTGDPNTAHHATASASNIGQYVFQDRANHPTALNEFTNCSAQAAPISLTDTYWAGPAVDVGNSAAGPWIYDTGCSYTGYVLEPPFKCMDFRREAAYLCDGGAIGNAGWTIKKLTTQNGGIVHYQGTDSWVSLDEMLQDADVSTVPPAVRIIGRNGGGTALLRNVQTADAVVSESNPTVSISPDLSANVVTTIGCGVVVGPHLGLGDTPNWLALAQSLPSMGAAGVWGGQRIAGDHPASRLSYGPIGARNRNIVGPRSEWVIIGTAAVTAGIDSPDGNLTAYRITPAAPQDGVYFVPATTIDRNAGGTITHSVGDLWAYGFFMRRVSGAGPLQALFEIGPSPQGQQLLCEPDYVGAGEWMWVKAQTTLTDIGGIHATYRVSFTMPDGASVFDVWAPMAIRVPVSVGLTQAEWQEYVMTMRPTDRYLLQGVSGTMPGTKLVAHGGLGTAARYTIGGGAGQITIGAAAAQAIEVFDEAGASLGVLRPNAFTVN